MRFFGLNISAMRDASLWMQQREIKQLSLLYEFETRDVKFLIWLPPTMHQMSKREKGGLANRQRIIRINKIRGMKLWYQMKWFS